MHNPDGTYTEFINKRITEFNLSPRKDAVVMNSFVVVAVKAFLGGRRRVHGGNSQFHARNGFAQKQRKPAKVISNPKTNCTRKKLGCFFVTVCKLKRKSAPGVPNESNLNFATHKTKTLFNKKQARFVLK